MPPLSQKFDNDFIDEKISVGSIVSIDVGFVDHPKWNVILEITEDKYLIASVFINSDINYKYINSVELQELQLEVTQN